MKKSCKKLAYWILVFSASMVESMAAPCQKITLHYDERIPYLVTESEQNIWGLTGTPAALAFEKAEVDFNWQKTPSKRQIYTLRENNGCDCLVGWFKTPEREQFAKYTLPIYYEKPHIALARTDNDKISSGATVESVLKNQELTLLTKDGYSYGEFLDNEIIKHSPKNDTSSTENIKILEKIHLKRGDYFFISTEEVNNLIASSKLNKKDFKYITFSDMPEGEKRYILCSQKVDDMILRKLNKAISDGNNQEVEGREK